MIASSATAPESASMLTSRSLLLWRNGPGQASGPLRSRKAHHFDVPVQDLVLRVTVRFRAVFLDVPAFAYRRHRAGVARDRPKVREEAIRLADKLVRDHPQALEQIGRTIFLRRQARRHARLAEIRLRAGDREGARRALAEARALRPASLAYRLRALWLRLGQRS